ncbi:zinc finger protein 644a [Lampris incognitus]|uniref:zinc finger protein 644a n=1 Tax=Lampris incognitus TaxID=2546036 RepID=UPI0024B5A1C3|nr:zinc finger protein 644a [Lampris incognitus]
MSCLAGVDEDDKDADSEMNALTFLQEPVRMAQEPISYSDSFGKPSPLKQNNGVLDVLSDTEMLSPVGLGNGPSSHHATQAHDLNSLCTEKEEEKSITPLKTVQEIDTAGIWGFDVESPENSLDNFSSAGDVHWDPHKEFMQFLWENNDESPGEEPPEEVSPPVSQRRRKRKMDMVVMVDPSDNLYPDLSHKSSEESSDDKDQAHSIPVSKVRNLRKHSNPQSSATGKVSQYPNGTVKAIKKILYNTPTRNLHENSIGHKLSPLKGRLSINSCSEEKPSCYPCSKCNLSFKKEQHLQRHMKSHVDTPNMLLKPFICRECGQSFKQSCSLIKHMSVHPEKSERLVEEKGMNDMKEENGNAKLCCPQCPFGTNSPNMFVQHAKTHNKTKRYFDCGICNFKAASEKDLRKHEIRQHTVIPVKQKDQVDNDESGVFSCYNCSYKAFSKNVFKNHLQRRHRQSYEEHKAAQNSDKMAQPPVKQQVPTSKSPVEDSELTSKISIKSQVNTKRAHSPSVSNDISDLFKNDKIGNKGLKSQLSESKLDKSINVLLSRQRYGKKPEEQQKKVNSNCIASALDSNSDKSDSNQLPILSLKAEDTISSTKCRRQPSVSNPDSNCEFDASAAEKDLSSNNVPKSIFEQSAMKKSPSKRKMSTPYRNTTDLDSCFKLPKHLPSPKRLNIEEMDDCEDKDIFHFKDTDDNTTLFDSSIKKENTHIYTYSRRMSMRGALQASKRLFEKINTEGHALNDADIKEECIETEVFRESFESQPLSTEEPFSEDLTMLDLDRKTCPYCPAVFESGVGLSNHVRGHLHRVGLSYNARHVVSPEQVASQDKRPRIRRKMSAIRRLERALQMESSSEVIKSTHACPLCGDTFDNKTGQSNHIRGHLKRLGKNISTKTKSPLCLLRELMRDKKEVHRALQILGKKRNHFQLGASAKLASTDGLTPSPIEISKKNSIPIVYSDAKPQVPKFSLAGVASEKKLETKLEVKGANLSASALIGILKKRKCQEDSKLKGSSHISKNTLAVSSNSEHSTGSRVATSLPNSISEKGEFNRKVCIHCNATFHSGVSLSNHLRAYAKRKRTALLEGTTYDCKARRQRSRPGSKKKTLPVPQTPEEIYRLTCRFCDLVFQGPLSVQEDWIKHLQRHIMNTGVPHTGLGMVDVTLLPKDAPTPKTDQDSSLTATHAAS